MSKVCLFKKNSESCLWASNTFLQKICSFKFFSILEENCGADIIHGKFNCETFVHKWCKKLPLSKLYLPTKAKSFKFFSILEENCSADIIDGTFKCETFVDKWCKKRPLGKRLETQQLSLFNFLSDFMHQ